MTQPAPPLPPILLLDGGLGTTLADIHHCTFNDGTPLWSSQLLLTSPRTLLQAQQSFAAAGADVLLTATYQASYEGFARSDAAGGREGAEAAMRSAVGLARRAFSGRGATRGSVALSLGAYGATMVPSQEYSGRYDGGHRSRAQLREWHRERLAAFEGDDECWRDVDLVAFETLPVIEEIWAVRDVMGCLSKEMERRFWISCVFPGEGTLLPDGSSVREVVRAMLGKEEGAGTPMAIGINCTKVIKVESLIEEFEVALAELLNAGEVEEWPALVVYPDGTKGEVYNTTTKEWEKVGDQSDDTMGWDEMLMGIIDRARRRAAWNAILVGGCCKTTPTDIANLRKRIDGH